MGNIKEINIKNQTYYFFDDIISIEDFDPNLLKIDKKSYKNINIYYIGYITMKDSDYVKINSVNPLYLIINEVVGHIEEKHKSKYLVFDSANENNEVLKKDAGLWYVIKNKIETINKGKKSECNKDFIKIKFDIDDNLPLNRTLKLHNMTIIIRSVFEEDGKLYPQIYLDECLYELEMLEYDRIGISEGIDIN